MHTCITLNKNRGDRDIFILSARVCVHVCVVCTMKAAVKKVWKTRQERVQSQGAVPGGDRSGPA